MSINGVIHIRHLEMYLVISIIMSNADSGEHWDTYTLMGARKECDQIVSQRKVNQGKRNNGEALVYGPVVIFEDRSGEKLTKRDCGPMKVEQNINEDKLRNQRCPADRDTLMFVFHWLC